MPAAGPEPGSRTWRDAALVYTGPRVTGMVWLGFSAGLPYLLVFSTLSAWLRDVGTDLSVIGFFSLVGVTYSVKVIWAPVVDRLPFPFLTRLLGKRRGWMLAAQLGIATGLLCMSQLDPSTSIAAVALCAVLVAFSSATQDITIDAWRIEAADTDIQGAMAAAYVFGYRVALLVAGAGAFYIAEGAGWSVAYLSMAALTGVGIVATLLMREPAHPEASAERQVPAGGMLERFMRFVTEALIEPFIEFFTRSGSQAFAILALIALYKLSDITMGVMANPFYLDLGFSKTQIADVTKVFGFFMTIAGAALGGALVVRYGVARPLVAGAGLVAGTNLLFVLLALSKPSLPLLALVVSADNLCGGLASAVFIAYLSGLTNTAYTATQYALFSSLMTLPAKLLGGLSGVMVDWIGYAGFFGYSAALGIPGVVLAVYLVADRRSGASPAGGSG